MVEGAEGVGWRSAFLAFTWRVVWGRLHSLPEKVPIPVFNFSVGNFQFLTNLIGQKTGNPIRERENTKRDFLRKKA